MTFLLLVPGSVQSMLPLKKDLLEFHSTLRLIRSETSSRMIPLGIFQLLLWLAGCSSFSPLSFPFRRCPTELQRFNTPFHAHLNYSDLPSFINRFHSESRLPFTPRAYSLSGTLCYSLYFSFSNCEYASAIHCASLLSLSLLIRTPFNLLFTLRDHLKYHCHTIMIKQLTRA